MKVWSFMPVWRLGVGHAVHPRTAQGASAEQTAVWRVPKVRRPPVQPYRSDDTGRHVGAGFGRRADESLQDSFRAMNVRHCDGPTVLRDAPFRFGRG